MKHRLCFNFLFCAKKNTWMVDTRIVVVALPKVERVCRNKFSKVFFFAPFFPLPVNMNGTCAGECSKHFWTKKSNKQVNDSVLFDFANWRFSETDFMRMPYCFVFQKLGLPISVSDKFVEMTNDKFIFIVDEFSVNNIKNGAWFGIIFLPCETIVELKLNV